MELYLPNSELFNKMHALFVYLSSLGFHCGWVQKSEVDILPSKLFSMNGIFDTFLSFSSQAEQEKDLAVYG